MPSLSPRLKDYLTNAPLATLTPSLLVSPHPQAPSFPEGSGSEVQRFLGELAKPNASEDPEVLRLFREAALVNLFVFLKYVAGYSGPYNQLSWGLHVDLCNFRQGLLEPGVKGAAFIPRSSYKSTVMTHGAAAWELTRDPDLRVGVFSSKYERAAEFMHTTQRVFDDNELFGVLFPEFIPEGGYGSRWNDSEAVLPNRTRNYPEPNLKAHSAGGSTAGVHVDLAVFDDIIDDSQLNSDHGATADLYRMKNWLFTNMRTLLVGKASRVVLSATRYALDDPYEGIMQDAVEHVGWWQDAEETYPLRGDGEWVVYYRRALENGQSIFPEAYTAESLDRIAARDPWTFQTQYLNDPRSTGVLEFTGLLKPCTLDVVGTKGLCIQRPYAKGEVPLESCDLVFACDPAASEKRVSQRTSQTAIVVLATDWEDNAYFLEAIKGYWAPSVYIAKLFELREKYKGAQRATYVEMQAGFKVLGDIIREEEVRRGVFLNLRPVNALVHKEDTIRSVWEPLLKLGKVFINQSMCVGLEAEVALFPSVVAKDLLDAGKIALMNRIRGSEPALDGEDPELTELRRQRRVALRGLRADPIVGY